jgi:hypothetical protein
MQMNRTIDQFSLEELRSLKIRLEAQIRIKGQQASENEHKLLRHIIDLMQERKDYTYGPDVLDPIKQRKAIAHQPAALEVESIEPNVHHRGPYNSLEDCYQPGQTEIWYFKPGIAHQILTAIDDGHKELLPKPEDLSKTHVKVGTVNSEDQREIFAAMQSDQWSPGGEGKQMIKKLGLGHVSMSPGDVIAFPKRTVLVTKRGFFDLGARSEVSENIDFSAVIDGKRDLTESPAPMAFTVGDTVYYGSRKATLLGFVNGDRSKLLVELPNGSRDIFPAQGTSHERPSMLRRATQWAIGEDATLAVPQGVGQKPTKDRAPISGEIAKAGNAHFEPGQRLWQGSFSGKFVRFADGLRKQMALVQKDNGDYAMFNVGKLSTTKPKFLDVAKSFIKGESVSESFNPGQKVYCQGKSGVVIDYARGDATRSHLVVKLANGQTDSFPVKDTSVSPPQRKIAEDFGSSDISIAMQEMVEMIKAESSGHFAPTHASIEAAAQAVGSRFAEDLGVDDEEAARIMQHHFMLRFRSGSLKQFLDDEHNVEEDTVVASAGTAGPVNVQGGVIGEEDDEVDEGMMDVQKGAAFRPKMTDLHYFNTRGTSDWELEKLGMKKDKFGRWYLPQYDRSGDNYRKNFDTLANTFGMPRSIRLKK